MSEDWESLPGETPMDDLSGLKNRGIRTRAALNVAEGENIRQAVTKYLSRRPTRRMAPFTYDWLLKVHREMFGDAWKWAGQVRTTEKTVGISPALIGQELGSLCLDIAAWDEREDLLLEQSVMIHYRGVRIHPFENGNGRWSRLLASIWLRRHGKPAIAWAEAELGRTDSAIRTEYIGAIKAANYYDFGPLTELHERCLSDA